MKPSGSRKTHTLDVRPMLSRREEPFAAILAAVARLGPQDTFVLVTPFLPAPMIEKLRSEGFLATPERGADGVWRTIFSRGRG